MSLREHLLANVCGEMEAQFRAFLISKLNNGQFNAQASCTPGSRGRSLVWNPLQHKVHKVFNSLRDLPCLTNLPDSWLFRDEQFLRFYESRKIYLRPPLYGVSVSCRRKL